MKPLSLVTNLWLIGVLALMLLPSWADPAEGISWNQDNRYFKPASVHESDIAAFLRPAEFETKQLFAKGRFPNLVVTTDGTLIAAFGKVKTRRSEDGGKTWEPAQLLAEGFSVSGLTVDEVSGDILAFIEEEHPPAPLNLYRSKDNGKSWKPQPFTLNPNSFGHTPSLHMNENGICLRHGQVKGRLVIPCRWYGRSNYPAEFFHTHYTNAIFSDDGARTWQASEPVPLVLYPTCCSLGY